MEIQKSINMEIQKSIKMGIQNRSKRRPKIDQNRDPKINQNRDPKSGLWGPKSGTQNRLNSKSCELTRLFRKQEWSLFRSGFWIPNSFWLIWLLIILIDFASPFYSGRFLDLNFESFRVSILDHFKCGFWNPILIGFSTSILNPNSGKNLNFSDSLKSRIPQNMIHKIGGVDLQNDAQNRDWKWSKIKTKKWFKIEIQKSSPKIGGSNKIESGSKNGYQVK